MRVVHRMSAMTLKEWRDANKLSMISAAAKLQLSQSTISRIEAGKQWPDRDTLAKIVAGTDGAVTANDLLPMGVVAA